MLRFCDQCDKVIKGRSDKRFCNYMCRSEFNNSRYRQDGKHINVINALLKSNRQILKHCLNNNIERISKNSLLEMGFKFNYFTQVRANESDPCYFCYDYGYLPLENNYFALRIKDEEERNERVFGIQHY